MSDATVEIDEDDTDPGEHWLEQAAAWPKVAGDAAEVIGRIVAAADAVSVQLGPVTILPHGPGTSIEIHVRSLADPAEYGDHRDTARLMDALGILTAAVRPVSCSEVPGAAVIKGQMRVAGRTVELVCYCIDRYAGPVAEVADEEESSAAPDTAQVPVVAPTAGGWGTAVIDTDGAVTRLDLNPRPVPLAPRLPCLCGHPGHNGVCPRGGCGCKAYRVDDRHHAAGAHT